MGQTNINVTVEVAVTASGGSTPDYQNSAIDLSTAQGLFYEEVTNVGQFGDTGINDSFVDYPIFGSRLSVKQKGASSGAEPELRCLQPKSGDESLGYLALIAAGQTNSNVVFKLTWDDGHVEYIRTLVGQPSFAKGQNQNFREAVFGLGINQASLVDSTP